jgi:hypothetical protein
MIKIDLAELDPALLADLGGDTEGWEAFEAPFDGANVGNQAYHVVFHPDYERGGIVFVGSGASGLTSWTDAASPEEVLARFLGDDMRV